MTVTSSSNLSRYGYDLVGAVTQDAINAMLPQMDFGRRQYAYWSCYVLDPATKTIVGEGPPFVSGKIGGDPFAIPDKSDGSNPKVRALAEMGFRCGFLAQVDLPAGTIRLDRGSSLASYLLQCTKFSVIALDQTGSKLTFMNLQQAAGSPWTFEFDAPFDTNTYPGKLLPDLPRIQEYIRSLGPRAAVNVLQSHLKLPAATLRQAPAIPGLDPASDTHAHLVGRFIPELQKAVLFWNLPLGYVVMPVGSYSNSLPPVVPTGVQFEVSPNVDARGNPTTNYGLYTFDILAMSRRRPMPPVAPFNWNWLDPSAATGLDGATAIRRDLLADYLFTLLDGEIRALCIDTGVELTHSGETYDVTYTWGQSPHPTSLVKIAPAVGVGGHAAVMTFAYSHHSYDTSEAASHATSINGTFNYDIDGRVSFGANEIGVELNARLYVEYIHHTFGLTDKAVRVSALTLSHNVRYTFAVQEGRIVVTKKVVDAGGGGRLTVGVGNIDDAVNGCIAALTDRIKHVASNLEAALGSMANESQARIFSGSGKPLTVKDVGFSSGLDLVTTFSYQK